MLGRIYKTLFLLLISWPQILLADHCTVSQIAIVPGSWENTSTKTSFILQTQDSSGTSCHVTQTLRFSLESTITGSFTGQTGNALQFFISSNTANRNFYYDGHTSASYTLTARAGYGAADSWTTQFSTTYNSGTSSGGSASSTPETPSSVTSQVSNSGSSVHYNATSLSNKKPETASTVSAGRDRLGAVGSPIEFRAESNLSYTKSSLFRWNFGDGTEGAGEVVTHSYEYPGEYTVVLNAALPEGQAVSRIAVKVIDPHITIVSATPERIEVRNNSKQEVSLYGRILASGGNVFAFPLDTIIKPGQSLYFSSKVTELYPTNTAGVMLHVVGNTEQNKLPQKVLEENYKHLSHVEQELGELEAELALIDSKRVRVVSPKPQIVRHATSSEPIASEDVRKEEIKTAVAVKSGWFEIIKKFFLRTK